MPGRLGEDAGLLAAAAILGKKAQEISGTFSKKIPRSIVWYVRGGIAYVTAGGPGGQAAPNAAMFETHGARHPLFGNKRHWYDQPYRPFLEDATEAAGQEAADKYADIVIGALTKGRATKSRG